MLILTGTNSVHVGTRNTHRDYGWAPALVRVPACRAPSRLRRRLVCRMFGPRAHGHVSFEVPPAVGTLGSGSALGCVPDTPTIQKGSGVTSS